MTIGTLQVQVLGPFQLKRDGVLLQLPHSKKTRALFAYLAVLGRPQRREHLCNLLWNIPDDPRASLRWSLHKIRQVTGCEELLITDRQTAFLPPKMIELDFRKLASMRPNELTALDAAELHSGEFLEDLRLPRCPAYEAWRMHHQNKVWALRGEIARQLTTRLSHEPERGRPSANPSQSSVLTLPDDRAGTLPKPLVLERVGILPEYADEWRAAADFTSGWEGSAESSERPLRTAVAAAKTQTIHFCNTRDGAQIAYAVCGHGPPLVRAAHWMSHLQYDWESSIWRHWIDALSEETMLVRYDERGNGLSDWKVKNFSFEEMVADLESVVDAVGLPRFTLLGVSQSCSVSVAYAIRHPERVSGLILYGGFVKGWRRRGNPHEIATHEAMTTLIREGWGKRNPVFRRLFTAMFIPGASQEQMGWFDELQRISVSPQNAARLHDAFGEIDVSDQLSFVRAPTLVLHARHDAAVPFHAGKEFAAAIPGARFVDLDSANHILLRDEPAFPRFVEETRRFVAETAGVS